jgi:hypothetical protein
LIFLPPFIPNNALKTLIILLAFLLFITACSNNKLEEKGFSVSPETAEKDQTSDGIVKDSLSFPTRPGSILLTGHGQHRLTTVYKVNVNENGTTFIGTNNFYYRYDEFGETLENQWNDHFLPGFEIVYGYNLVNVSHHDAITLKKKDFFERPVLIKNLYYPSFSLDTLNDKPVVRDYVIISVYGDDTNKDGFINGRDLRRFYYFNMDAEAMQTLIPTNYSVFQSEYDPANDYMYVFAKKDENENGQGDDREGIHIFWIDLKNPQNSGRQY